MKDTNTPFYQRLDYLKRLRSKLLKRLAKDDFLYPNAKLTAQATLERTNAKIKELEGSKN